MFDDHAPEEAEPGYLGMAQVPLLPLSQGKPITGTFQLRQVLQVTVCITCAYIHVRAYDS